MYCTICGDDGVTLSVPRRYWSPDDGWMIGRFCRACVRYSTARPSPDDYAYDRRGDYVSEVDGAIDQLYG